MTRSHGFVYILPYEDPAGVEDIHIVLFTPSSRYQFNNT
jgi:hypothetical protein